MRIWSVSDMHIHNDDRLTQISEFLDRVDQHRPYILVLNGDIGDPWKTAWPNIVATQTWKRLDKTVDRRRSCNLKTIWIPENHDWSAKPSYLPGAKIVRGRYDYGDITFMHGWQFDISWNLIHRFAFWLLKNYPKKAVRLYQWLYKNTPATQKQGAFDEWNEHVGMVHFRARRWAARNRRRLIIGHTHCPAPFDGLMCDGGDMEDSFTWVQVDQDIVLRG